MLYAEYTPQTRIVWKQELPKYDVEVLVTIRKQDGSNSFGIAYFHPRVGFNCCDDRDVVAVAWPARSIEEFEDAKAKGMAGVIEWRTSGIPEKCGWYLLGSEFPDYVLYRFDPNEEGSDEFFKRDYVRAWAELPEPCAATKTIGELMDEE